jgi:hypothetical protein
MAIRLETDQADQTYGTAATMAVRDQPVRTTSASSVIPTPREAMVWERQLPTHRFTEMGSITYKRRLHPDVLDAIEIDSISKFDLMYKMKAARQVCRAAFCFLLRA